MEEWLHLIGRGEGIDTCPAVIARYYPGPEIAFVPLVDAPPATLVLAGSRDERHPLAEEFATLAVEVAAAPRRVDRLQGGYLSASCGNRSGSASSRTAFRGS
jgi:hypothetical protein